MLLAAKTIVVDILLAPDYKMQKSTCLNAFIRPLHSSSTQVAVSALPLFPPFSADVDSTSGLSPQECVVAPALAPSVLFKEVT